MKKLYNYSAKFISKITVCLILLFLFTNPDNVFAVPVTPTVSNTGICAPGTATLHVSASAWGLSFRWYTAYSGGSRLTTGVALGTIPVGIPVSNGSYTATFTTSTTLYVSTYDGISESTRVPIYIKVGIPANPTASTSQSICTGSNITTLQANVPYGSTANWFSGTTAFYGKVSAPGTYKVYSRDNTSGCLSSGYVTVAVAVKSLPANPVSPIINNDNNGNIILTKSTPPGTDIWYWQGTISSGASTANGGNSYPAPTDGNYYLRAYNNGCWSPGLSFVNVKKENFISGTNRILDKTNCIPGSIGGTIDVSPSGSATYTIPIGVSPGTHGMQPNLSIVYNSKSGNDILGYGWHLAGLSSISKVNKNPYYDGNNQGILLSNGVAWALDGQRLIPTGQNVFAPENNPYTKVEFNGTSYTVTTQDGMIMEYGNTADSRFLMAGNSISPQSYAINKVTDPDGNYCQFVYSSVANSGKYQIQEINYTGNSNAGLTPYNSIRFYYNQRPDINTLYNEGAHADQNWLLTSIKVVCEEAISREYTFSYFNDGIYTKLNKISLSADGLTYNPTIINYEKADYSTTVSDAGVNFGSLNKNNLYFCNLNDDGITDLVKWDRDTTITAMFGQNGGGYSLPKTMILPTSGIIYSYPPSGNPNNHDCPKITIHEDLIYSYKDIQVLDWNNDGKDEILVHYAVRSVKCTETSWIWCGLTQSQADVSGRVNDKIDSYEFNEIGFSLPSNLITNLKDFNHPIEDTYKYFYGDFNSDGKLDRLMVHKGNLAGVAGIDMSNLPNIANIEEIRSLDFDGDGQFEFLALTKEGKGEIYKLNFTSNTFDRIFGDIATTVYAKPVNLFLGDFNGDGITDYLANTNSLWNISYGTGKGFNTGTLPSGLTLSKYLPSQTGTFDGNKVSWNYDTYRSYIILSYMPYETVDYMAVSSQAPAKAIYNPASTLCIDDINNDGKSDIVYALNGKVNVYFSNGLNFKESQAINASSVSIPSNICGVSILVYDLNSDGAKEIIYGNDDNPFTSYSTQIGDDPYNNSLTIVPGSPIHENYRTIYFKNHSNLNLLVRSITDGNNINSKINYASNFTNISGTRNFPVIPITTPINLASNITTKYLESNKILSYTSYTYQNGYIHAQGKGFLGFSSISSSELISGESNTSNYSFTLPGTTGVYYTWLSSQSASKNNVLLSTSNYNMGYYGGDISKKFFFPISKFSSSTDNLLCFTKTNSIVSFDATLGRVTNQKSNSSDGWETETISSYSKVSGNISRLSNESKTNKLGSDAFTNTVVNNYSSSKPLQLASIVTQGLITTNYTYDNFGNVIGESVVTADGTRANSCTYESKGRFVNSSTSPEGYTSHATNRPCDGAKLSETDYNNLITTYSHQVQNASYITRTNLPDGNISTTTLGWHLTTAGGNISDEEKAWIYFSKNELSHGKTVTSYFNGIGQKLSELTSGYNGATHKATYTYNPDLTTNTALSPGYLTPVKYSYQPDGRLSSITGPNQMDISYKYECNKTTVTNNTTGEIKSQTIDASGNVNKVDGTNGEIIYQYFASGNLKQVTTLGDATHTTSLTYDLLGNQLSLIDPDAGKTSYTYNGFGQLLTQTDNKGQTISCNYDAFGRPVSLSGPGTSSTLSYYSTPGKLGRLQNETRDGVSKTYDYDNLGRPSTIITSGAGKTFTTEYHFNSFGQLRQINNPTGLAIEYTYDNTGNITTISNAADHSMIWKGDSKNNRDQWTNFSMGNGLKTSWTYDNNARLSLIQTGTFDSPSSIQNLGFSFNNNGQLVNRTNGTLSESFVYDNLDRLTKATLGTEVQEFNYQANGNISNTSLAGNYTYLANKPHAVSGVVGVTAIGQAPTLITTSSYTADNKIAIIDNGTYRGSFSYGPGGNRFKVDNFQGGTLRTSKIYIDNNEFVYNNTGNLLCQRTFIFAPTGICAIYQDTVINGTSSKEMYYIHTDYLGSWLSVTDATGSLKNSYSYDAWGRPRDPATWVLKPISITDALLNLNAMQPRFDRGYTGHEHMSGFGLINMNGRLYDPYLQRFISPDNEVQDPSNTQNFNRYAYCLNNPLKYTDPSGNEYWDASMDPDIHPVWYYQYTYSGYLNDVYGGYDNLTYNLNVDICGGFAFISWDGSYTTGLGTAESRSIEEPTFFSGSVIIDLSMRDLMPSIGCPQLSSVESDISGLGDVRKYGGDGSGSVMDWTYYIADEINQYNPIACAWDYVDYIKYGTDRWGNEMGLFEGTLKGVGALPVVGGLAKVIGREVLAVGAAEVSAVESSTSMARTLGVQGEEAVGTLGSKTRIPSLTGTAKYRIPDGLSKSTLTEVKNVKSLSLTRQLNDFYLYSTQRGLQFNLYTRPTTTFSARLQNLINQGSINVYNIPGL